LKKRIKEEKQQGEILRTTFALFEFLLKALKKEQQLAYFLVKINQENFIAEDYIFKEEEDQAYYANFLKLMVRKINEDNRYLSLFLNSKEPHFPLLLQLLKMHNCKDTIMHTSSKLAILEISNNPSPQLQHYLGNFPFVLFYPLYTQQILSSLKQLLEGDDFLIVENLQSSLKYMEDFLESKERSVVDMYTNAFLKIVGRFIYLELTHLS
jgi:hypothetical protein